MPENVGEVVAAVRAVTDKPLYAKLSAAVADLGATARAAEAAGADGLSLVNTVKGLALDERTLQPVLARGAGGLSGPALRPVALAAVHTCFRETRLPIVGMGGVARGRHALELLAAGASDVADRHRALRRPRRGDPDPERAGGRAGGARLRQS